MLAIHICDNGCIEITRPNILKRYTLEQFIEHINNDVLPNNPHYVKTEYFETEPQLPERIYRNSWRFDENEKSIKVDIESAKKDHVNYIISQARCDLVCGKKLPSEYEAIVMQAKSANLNNVKLLDELKQLLPIN